MSEIRGPLARCDSLQELKDLLVGAKVGIFEGRKVTIHHYQYTFNQIINRFLRLAKLDALRVKNGLPELANDLAEKIAKLNKLPYGKGLSKKQLYNLKMRQAHGNLGMIVRYGKKYREAEKLKKLAFKQLARGADLAYKKTANALILLDYLLFDKKTPRMIRNHLQTKYLQRVKSLGPKLFRAVAAEKLLIEKEFKKIDRVADKHAKKFLDHVNKTIATQLKYIEKKTKAAEKASSKKKPMPKASKPWIGSKERAWLEEQGLHAYDIPKGLQSIKRLVV